MEDATESCLFRCGEYGISATPPLSNNSVIPHTLSTEARCRWGTPSVDSSFSRHLAPLTGLLVCPSWVYPTVASLHPVRPGSETGPWLTSAAEPLGREGAIEVPWLRSSQRCTLPNRSRRTALGGRYRIMTAAAVCDLAIKPPRHLRLSRKREETRVRNRRRRSKKECPDIEVDG